MFPALMGMGALADSAFPAHHGLGCAGRKRFLPTMGRLALAQRSQPDMGMGALANCTFLAQHGQARADFRRSLPSMGLGAPGASAPCPIWAGALCFQRSQPSTGTGALSTTTTRTTMTTLTNPTPYVSTSTRLSICTSLQQMQNNLRISRFVQNPTPYVSTSTRLSIHTSLNYFRSVPVLNNYKTRTKHSDSYKILLHTCLQPQDSRSIPI